MCKFGNCQHTNPSKDLGEIYLWCYFLNLVFVVSIFSLMVLIAGKDQG
ncbi:hypothetical protein AM1_0041 [Acaryochloris marina MBIC11017]|uniref:Uncharacterized protein n=1 Tax=Acaryochloris marina (strain MBIC 11017) TaxID=329726 RepID=B0C517_ACAM1|nr:hypothetical protein AM1_0041 [Acaryochloris marina MBIC11017]